MNGESQSEFSTTVRIRSNVLSMPTVRDAVVLGKDSLVGCEAMLSALKFLQPTVFEYVKLAPDDDVLSGILVRANVLKKIPQDKLVEIVLRRCKPVMDSNECLNLEITTESVLEDQT